MPSSIRMIVLLTPGTTIPTDIRKPQRIRYAKLVFSTLNVEKFKEFSKDTLPMPITKATKK